MTKVDKYLKGLEPWALIERSRAEDMQRIADSNWFVTPYEFGFIVHTLYIDKEGRPMVEHRTAKYPNDIPGLLYIVQKLGFSFKGDIAKDLMQAIHWTTEASKAAVELQHKLKVAG